MVNIRIIAGSVFLSVSLIRRLAVVPQKYKN
jgi:hypothetical protein